jgi:hypothetical protein
MFVKLEKTAIADAPFTKWWVIPFFPLVNVNALHKDTSLAERDAQTWGWKQIWINWKIFENWTVLCMWYE